jgi:hypothetical protein
MSNEKSAELTKPGVGALYDPASLGAPEFASILRGAGSLLFLRYGAMRSMPRFLSRSRSGSES